MRSLRQIHKLSNLRCPTCAAPQSPFELAQTAKWMHEDSSEHVAYVNCRACHGKLRLVDGLVARNLFGLIFICGGLSGLTVVAFAATALREKAHSNLWIAALVVAWLGFGFVLFHLAARVLKVEVAR